jgi:hypothetical protein
MKKKLGTTFWTIFSLVVCIVISILIWLIVKYVGQINPAPVAGLLSDVIRG